MPDHDHQPEPTGPQDPADLASLYAVGGLPPDEAEAFERRLREGDAACRAAFDAVRPASDALHRAAASPEQPQPRVREAMLKMIGAGAAPRDLGAWSATAAELDPRLTPRDLIAPDAIRLVRLPDGPSPAVPLGEGVSACIVAAGSLSQGNATLTRGQRVEPAGGPPTASEGCTLLVIGAPAAPRRRGGGGGNAGWLAAAAAVVLAAVGWWNTLAPPTQPIPGTLRDVAMIEADPATQVWPVQAQGELATAGKLGEFVWNPRLQRGYLRLTNLPTNNPVAEQYQGWMFDTKRETYPVSAGIFDVGQTTLKDRGGRLVLMVQPGLPVKDLSTFAVTIEHAGGVVVTDKSRLVLVAQKGVG